MGNNTKARFFKRVEVAGDVKQITTSDEWKKASHESSTFSF
jgi:hypothetical protein